MFVAILLNGPEFINRILHVYPEYFKNIPTERLVDEGVLPQHINDDILRCFLDALYTEGVSGLYEELVFKVVSYLGLQYKNLYLDATSFHLDGESHRNFDANMMHIIQSYSRDHRPDLNQIVFNLITENRAGITSV